ncbi:hypothetical protein PG996_002060 [Apiospora saccharicola]|uniref:Uncharacterized protein n=1 Tax=Apiospora saccharicola TaxID=335842 RepID=A0ABR1WIE2_9PEZI
MPFPQSSSTCCRAINRRLLVQHDCVWVPESALSAAYERYCSASRIAFRRHGSSVPGPLENRKRQNKRQMGELTFGHAHGSAPLWDLENLPDLTQWKWKPPTERRSRQTVQADRNLWNAVVAWLSPRNDARSQSVLEQPASTSSDILQDATPITMADPTSVALGSDTESAGWIEQGFDALIQDVSLDRTLRMCPNFSSFCDTLRDGLSEGRISAGALCSLVPSMADGLARSALTLDIQQEKKVFERLKAQFIGASIDGLEALRARLGDTHFDGNVWEILLQEASHLRFNSLRTFARLMSLIPSNGIGSLSVVIHANLNNFLAAVSQDTHRTHEKQINKLAGIIQDLGLMEHRHILDEVLTDLAQNTHSTNFTVMRFCWLQVLARLRSLDDEALANACVFLETGITAEPLTSKQIARIFLGRVNSCNSLKRVTSMYTSLNNCQESRCLAQLSSFFWSTGQPQYIRVLCTFLLRMGRQQDILHLLRGVTKLVKNEATPLANLAVGLGHTPLALQVYFRYCESRFASKLFWRTEFATNLLITMMQSNSLDHKRILTALKMFQKRRLGRLYSMSSGRTVRGASHGTSRATYERKERGLRIKQVQKAEAAAVAFAGARHLPDRCSFRLVQQCVNYIRSHGSKVSSKGLQALWKVITIDLVKSRPGRATRLKWFFRVLFKERGLGETRAAHSKLVQWQSRVLTELQSSNGDR